ncbi:bifunctional nuclease family protein [Thermosulfurimonas sp. F29]|uniref:bifunctional nuclease family protein n=1 Tax=Thermosulfurimonas sp. F29 TaxID=2867247 RepID=UPI001C828EBC|nr:bifunctional nuclease family protein [Thermosulfurimonas sp. F29]MBX6423639.1 bifunctional nuclease family protein [Thermosulfurimonas sp. F29]
MKVKMKIQAVAMDPVTNSPVMILREEGGERGLPIWIGILEATAIASKLENIQFPRPMTHDLLKNILDQLQVRVPRIEICDLRDNTYYALITLDLGGREIQIDARPSDAVALALRTGAEIYVHEEVLAKSEALAEEARKKAEETTVTATSEKDKEKLKDLLERLDPQAFKYKM